jgi:hypothetical protein
MRGSVLALHLAGQPGQAVQQGRLVLARGTANGLRQFGQFALRKGQYAGGFPRGGQAQQGGHAVGFDLQQALHQAAQAARRHAAGQQHHARAAVGVQGEIGVHLTVAIGHGGGHQGVFLQHMLDQGRPIKTVNRQDP